MKLSKTHSEKVGDEHTRAILEAATNRTRLRAIFTVARALQANDHDSPLPRATETRQEMRVRLIRARRAKLAREYDPLTEKLALCGLDLKGGRIPRLTRRIVVDGSAGDILNGVELAEIERVHIDRHLQV